MDGATSTTFNRLTMNRVSLYLKLIRFDKPVGTLLLLWPTLWALWLASNGHPSMANLLVFGLGTFLMRSVGCIFNDIADRKIDSHVIRTRNRPLTQGLISIKEALLLALILSLMAGSLVLTRNTLTQILALPALFLAATYPYTKRFFPVPQAYLGLAFGFGIPMAYAATGNEIPTEAWLLMGANFFWTVAYDTCYAMVDRPDDQHLNIHSSALFFGRYDVFGVMLCQGIAGALMACLFWHHPLGPFPWMSLALSSLLVLRHYFWIRRREPQNCFRAFINNQWIGALIWLGLFLNWL